MHPLGRAKYIFRGKANVQSFGRLSLKVIFKMKQTIKTVNEQMSKQGNKNKQTNKRKV